jgi:hypothetical protein
MDENIWTKEGGSNRRIKLHNKDHRNLYSLPKIIKSSEIEDDDMSGTFRTCGEDEKRTQHYSQKSRRKEAT